MPGPPGFLLSQSSTDKLVASFISVLIMIVLINNNNSIIIVKPYGSGLGLSRCLGPGECLHSFNNNNTRRLVTLAEHTSDHGKQTNSSTEEKGESRARKSSFMLI